MVGVNCGDENDAQAGAADVLQFGKIEQQTAVSGIDLLQQILFEGRSGDAVETALGPYLKNIIRHRITSRAFDFIVQRPSGGKRVSQTRSVVRSGRGGFPD